LGFPSAEDLVAADTAVLRERFAARHDDGTPVPLEQLPGRRALLGERPEPLTVRYRAPGTAEDRWSRVQATPVFDDAGRVRLAINVIED
ncbi:hypothetical protein, partial [Vibrio parahaemolyticus]|uniref:hypothetical protein n=1 Tax=Vibrio parahaemolyticus TaxID=670 RepID=UPI002113781D